MTDLAIGLSTADAVALAEVARRVAKAHRRASREKARLVRAYAEAEQVAARIAAGSPGSGRVGDMARRTVASEIAVPLHLSDRSVQAQLDEAATLVRDYPTTLDAWEAGRITRGHVHALVRAGRHLAPEGRRDFDEAAVTRCERTTAGRAKESLAQLADRLHPRTATERHRDARETRRVWLDDLGEGMSRITADVPTILGRGAEDRLTRMSRALADLRDAARTRVREQRTVGIADDDMDAGDLALAADTRTAAQIRADVFVDLLLTGGVDADPTAAEDGYGELAAIRAHVQVVVNAMTLVGRDEHPADLVGAGSLDAATARELVGDCSGFDRLFLDPATGQVLATDRYTPTADLRRRLRARDRHCRFPGCRVPAIRCEHDHTVDFALGGPTTLANLAGLCQRHHSMKQFTPWRVRQLGSGVLEWISPTGRTYVDEPPPPVVFSAPAPQPPPF